MLYNFEKISVLYQRVICKYEEIIEKYGYFCGSITNFVG